MNEEQDFVELRIGVDISHEDAEYLCESSAAITEADLQDPPEEEE